MARYAFAAMELLDVAAPAATQEPATDGFAAI